MYNATVIETWSDGTIGYFVAEVTMINGKLQMLRSNALQCTGYEGKIGTLKAGELSTKYGSEVAFYDVYYRESNPTKTLQIVLDNCEGYKNQFKSK